MRFGTMIMCVLFWYEFAMCPSLKCCEEERLFVNERILKFPTWLHFFIVWNMPWNVLKNVYIYFFVRMCEWVQAWRIKWDRIDLNKKKSYNTSSFVVDASLHFWFFTGIRRSNKWASNIFYVKSYAWQPLQNWKHVALFILFACTQSKPKKT